MTKISEASNAGDYKTKYKKTRDGYLDRPGKGRRYYQSLKLKFAEGIKGNKNQNV